MCPTACRLRKCGDRSRPSCAESAEIDDAGDAGGARGRGEVPRPHRLPFFEAARVPHRVDEVVCDIDAFERRSQGRRIQDVARDHARAGIDAGREIRGMTSETAHLVPLCLQDRQETSTHVARGAGQKNVHRDVSLLPDQAPPAWRRLPFRVIAVDIRFRPSRTVASLSTLPHAIVAT